MLLICEADSGIGDNLYFFHYHRLFILLLHQVQLLRGNFVELSSGP